MSIDPSATIHPSAVVENGAAVGADCKIGPLAYVGPEASLGPKVVLKPHAVVMGRTEIGEGSEIYSFATVGEIPQDLKYQGEPSRLEIGKRVRIRECVTVNIGTDGGGGVTRIGDDAMIMAGAHIAHDVQIGDRVIVVSNSAIAGHCVIGDEVIVGGLSGIQQWIRVGKGAIIGGMAKVTNDVIPFGLVQGPRGELDGLNLVGLKRKGVPRSDITALRAAYQMLAQGEGTFQDRARRLHDETESEYVREVAAFVMNGSDRSYMTPG